MRVGAEDWAEVTVVLREVDGGFMFDAGDRCSSRESTVPMVDIIGEVDGRLVQTLKRLLAGNVRNGGGGGGRYHLKS